VIFGVALTTSAFLLVENDTLCGLIDSGLDPCFLTRQEAANSIVADPILYRFLDSVVGGEQNLGLG